MKDLIITHSADIDGVSPVILYSLTDRKFDYKLSEIYELDDVIDEVIKQNKCYENVYITDLTISLESYEKLENSIYKGKIKVFDHHKTHSYAENKDYVTLDVTECGTTLFYNYLCEKFKIKKKILDEYVMHVKDIDLWLWGEKENMTAKGLADLFALYGKERYIKEMKRKLKRQEQFHFSSFEKKILLLEQDNIDKYIDRKDKEIFILDWEDKHFGVVFGEKYRSELGNTLSERHPELDFIVMVNFSGGVSFRTIKDIDVSFYASKIGGGGHKKASGAPLQEEIKKIVLENIFKGCHIDENK